MEEELRNHKAEHAENEAEQIASNTDRTRNQAGDTRQNHKRHQDSALRRCHKQRHGEEGQYGIGTLPMLREIP